MPYDEDLAWIHDAGHGALAWSAAAVVREALRAAGFTSGLVVDLGCGSGILAHELCQAGYDVLGLDQSEALLALARARAPGARFQLGSLWSAHLPACVAVTSVGECLNYRFDPADPDEALPGLVSRIHQALCPGGLLLFDVAEPGRVPGPGSQRGFREEEEWATLVTAEEDAAGRELTRHITSFRRVGEFYRRTHEVHRLRLLPRAMVTALIERAGFRVEVLDGYGSQPFAAGHAGFLARRR